MGLDMLLLFGRGHDVDGPAEGGGAEHPGGGAFQNLDALDVLKGHGKVGRQVAGLRVADVHAVEQYGDLVKGASPDGDVRLYAHGAPLADVDAGGILQEVVHTLYRRVLDGLAVQYSHNPCHFRLGQRHPASDHFNSVHLVYILYAGEFRLRGNHAVVGERQRGDSQHADGHFLVQGVEHGVGLVHEMGEADYR